MADEVIVLADYRKPPDEPGELMAQISIYSDGDGTLWLADAIGDKEQFNWLAAKIAEVTGAVLRTKAERCGTL